MAEIASQQWKFLSRLLPFFRKHFGRLNPGLVCVVLTAFFVLTSPYVMGRAVDSLYQPITQAKFVRYAAVIIGLKILAVIFRFGMRAVSAAI